MKTIIEWINTFPSPYKEKAIKAMENETFSEREQGELHFSASSALFSAFIWDFTPEGHDFWEEFNKLL